MEEAWKPQTCFYRSAKIEITIEDLKTKNILLQVCQDLELQL